MARAKPMHICCPRALLWVTMADLVRYSDPSTVMHWHSSTPAGSTLRMLSRPRRAVARHLAMCFSEDTGHRLDAYQLR
uniref:Uncharacterized protein n=1 Tax=uncultured marine virus TaxID=186617 RepID=A0A0F7L697_9VIRU|nr:hypothetical protein [uncultured marine virus]